MIDNLNYEFNRESRWSTVVSLFWNRQSGKPYSTILADAYPYNTINGDYFDDNDLIYVPTGADDVVVNWGTWEDLEAYLEKAGLMKYAGQIAPRNVSFAPPGSPRPTSRSARTSRFPADRRSRSRSTCSTSGT